MTDALVLMDTALDALMLVLALRMAGLPVRPVRLLGGALFGAGAAALLRAAEISRPWTAAAWLPLAMGMMALAGGRRAMRRPLALALLLLCAAGLLGGTVQALQGATGSPAAAYALGGAAVAAMACCAARSRRAAGDVRRVRVIIRRRGREAAFDGMIDSGNTLRDYLTHLPVIVLPCGGEGKKLLLDGAPMRPILADTAGGRQMMQCFTAESAFLCGPAGKRSVRAVIALSPGLAAGTPALVPAALMDAYETQEQDMQRGN